MVDILNICWCGGLHNELTHAQDLCALEDDELNDWEAEFVDDVTKLLERGGTLSPKQSAKLKDLWERECA